MGKFPIIQTEVELNRKSLPMSVASNVLVRSQSQPIPWPEIEDADPNPLAGMSEKDQLLFRQFGWGPKVEPRFPTITSAIIHQMRLQPDAIAAETENGQKSLSYGALDRASKALAEILLENGVKKGDAVCLYLQRSLEMLVGIVAILRIGAAYVPQHVGVAPPHTLEHIARFTGTKVMLTLPEMIEEMPTISGVATRSIALEQLLKAAPRVPAVNWP